MNETESTCKKLCLIKRNEKNIVGIASLRISLLPKWSSGQVNWRTSSKSAFTFFEYKKILIRVLVH